MKDRLILVVIFCFSLVACTAATKTQKIDANARPVKDIQVLAHIGDLPNDGVVTPSQRDFYKNQFKAALMERFPSIFRANGVLIQQPISIQNNSKQEFTRAKQHVLETAMTSHILILHVESFTYWKRYTVVQSLAGVNFLAQLWDVQEKRIVWEAHPRLGIVEEQPLLRTQHLAGQLLNGMNADGLIALQQSHAIDLAGERISDYYIGTKDR